MRRLLALAAGLAALAAPAGADSPPVLDAAPARPGARERLAEIQRRVQAVAIYPALARSRQVSGETLVAFTVTRAGAPEQIRIHSSSGSALLDRAAIRAVEDAAPLPWVYGEVRVPVTFQLLDPP